MPDIPQSLKPKMPSFEVMQSLARGNLKMTDSNATIVTTNTSPILPPVAPVVVPPVVQANTAPPTNTTQHGWFVSNIWDLIHQFENAVKRLEDEILSLENSAFHLDGSQSNTPKQSFSNNQKLAVASSHIESLNVALDNLNSLESRLAELRIRYSNALDLNTSNVGTSS